MKQEIQLTVIQRIIYYSKCILILRIVLNLGDRIKELLALIPTPFYDFDNYQKSTKEQLTDRIKQYETKIRLLLYPLFQGIDFGYIDSDPHWHLTAEDLQRGYLLLEKVEDNPEKNPDKYIIPLSNYKDNRNDIREGTLIHFTKVATVLGNFKNMQGNTPKINSYLDNQLSGVELIPKVRRLRIKT